MGQGVQKRSQPITAEAFDKAISGDYSDILMIVAAYTEAFGDPNPVQLAVANRSFYVRSYFSNWEWTVRNSDTGVVFGYVTLGMGLRMMEEEEGGMARLFQMIDNANEPQLPREVVFTRNVGIDENNEMRAEMFTLNFAPNVFADATDWFYEAIDALSDALPDSAPAA